MEIKILKSNSLISLVRKIDDRIIESSFSIKDDEELYSILQKIEYSVNYLINKQ